MQTNNKINIIFSEKIVLTYSNTKHKINDFSNHNS